MQKQVKVLEKNYGRYIVTNLQENVGGRRVKKNPPLPQLLRCSERILGIFIHLTGLQGPRALEDSSSLQGPQVLQFAWRKVIYQRETHSTSIKPF